jgi:cob(I)alamin adenosyltransferase
MEKRITKILQEISNTLFNVVLAIQDGQINLGHIIDDIRHIDVMIKSMEKPCPDCEEYTDLGSTNMCDKCENKKK